MCYPARKCMECGTEFTPLKPNQICCCIECQVSREKMLHRIRELRRKVRISKKEVAEKRANKPRGDGG